MLGQKSREKKVAGLRFLTTPKSKLLKKRSFLKMPDLALRKDAF